MADKKFVFIITHSFDKPDVVAGAMQIAANMKAFDIELDFFLMDNGVLLAKKGFADTIAEVQKKDEFSMASDLLKTLTEDFGVKFYICQSCVKHYGLNRENLIEHAEIKPGSFLGEMLLERQSVTF